MKGVILALAFVFVGACSLPNLHPAPKPSPPVMLTIDGCADYFVSATVSPKVHPGAMDCLEATFKKEVIKQGVWTTDATIAKFGEKVFAQEYPCLAGKADYDADHYIKGYWIHSDVDDSALILVVEFNKTDGKIVSMQILSDKSCEH